MGTCGGVGAADSGTIIASIEGREGAVLLGAWDRGIGLGFGLVPDAGAVGVPCGCNPVAKAEVEGDMAAGCAGIAEGVECMPCMLDVIPVLGAIAMDEI